MKRPVLVLAGALAALQASVAGADPVIFLGQSAYVDGVPVHALERPLRGRGTYDNPYSFDDEGDYDRPYHDDRGSLRSRQILGLLRERGFHSFADIERFRAIYGVSATDPDGNRVRLAVDARTGAIRHARVIAYARGDHDRRFGGYDDYDDYDDYDEPSRVRPDSVERRDLARPPRSAAIEPPPSGRPAARRLEDDVKTAAVEPGIVIPPLPKARPAAPAAATAALEPVKPRTTNMDPTGNTVRLPKPPAEPEEAATSAATDVPAAAAPQAGTRNPPIVRYRPPAAPSAPPAAELEEPGKNPLVVY